MGLLLPTFSILSFTSAQAADVPAFAPDVDVRQSENHRRSIRRTSQLMFIA